MGHTIETVILKDLCVGCGTCYSACPLEAITLIKKDVFTPSIDLGKCNNCGLCEFVCPGYHVDHNLFAPEIKKEEKHSSYFGKYVNVYLGHAKEPYVRFMGSSGGTITAVLTYALKERIIDGALVVTTIGINPVVMIAESSRELRQAMGSKYIPVPLSSGLRKILNTDGRFAFVGLPCHLLGLSRMAILYPILAKKIALKLGLFCGRGFDFHFINYVLKDHGICPTKVRKMNFRGYGWPGKVYVNYTSKGESKEAYINYTELGKYSGAYLFMPRRCIFCPDLTAELADISFGDAWLKEIKEIDTQGTSIIVTRNAWGNKVLAGAAETGFINITESSGEAVIRSQSLALNFHKISFITRCQVAKSLGMKTPLVNVEVPDKRSVSTLLFSTSLIITQIAYKILKNLGISELIPKSMLKTLGICYVLLGLTGYNLAIRGMEAL